MSKKLIEVDAQSFDDLMYWLDRCAEKGHLENCADLVDPWAIFDANGWRVVEATKPAAGEPVCQVENGGVWEDVSEQQQSRCQDLAYRTRTLWTAPPAAAHGDEAVRKDAERYQALRNTPEIFIGVAEGEDMVFLKSPEQLDQLADNAAAMRAQGGEGGEV